MKGKVFTSGALLLALIAVSGLTFVIRGRAEFWEPFVPSSKDVELFFWMKGGMACVDVRIVFYAAGYEVKDWGNVSVRGRELWVSSEIWSWMGVTVPAITEVSHTYELGHLKSGNYTFTFMAWGVRVKSIQFVVRNWSRPGILPY